MRRTGMDWAVGKATARTGTEGGGTNRAGSMAQVVGGRQRQRQTQAACISTPPTHHCDCPAPQAPGRPQFPPSSIPPSMLLLLQPGPTAAAQSQHYCSSPIQQQKHQLPATPAPGPGWSHALCPTVQQGLSLPAKSKDEEECSRGRSDAGRETRGGEGGREQLQLRLWLLPQVGAGTAAVACPPLPCLILR